MSIPTAEVRPVIVIKMDDGNAFNLPWSPGASLHEFIGLWKTGGHFVENSTGVVLMYGHMVWARLATVIVDTTPVQVETKQ